MTPKKSKPLAIIPTGMPRSKAALSLAGNHPRDLGRDLWVAEEPCANNRPLRAPFVLFTWTQLCNNLVINSADTMRVLQPNRGGYALTPTNPDWELHHVTLVSMENWNLGDDPDITLFKSGVVPKELQTIRVSLITWLDGTYQGADQAC